jgi:mannose-P-dolichol utilization defect protein 1
MGFADEIHSLDPMEVAMKLLGMLIIVGSMLNKAPLFMNILKTKSVAGMSPPAVYSECLMYANAAFYSYLQGNPFTAYGETLLITIQSAIVILLMWKLKVEPKVSLQERFIVSACFAAYVSIVFSLPADQRHLLLSINMPVTFFSRGSQIYCYYTAKHTGSQSIVTNIMNFTGSAIRVMTTINLVGFDIPMLAGYGISLFLNAIMITQFLIYKKNTAAYFKELEAKEAKKKA